MDIADLKQIIETTMPEKLYMRPGAVLSSGVSTLRGGDAYIMGVNPGGDPGEIPDPIIELLAPPDGVSAYTHECWQANCAGPPDCRHMGADGAILENALVKHQRNMIALAEILRATPATLFSANAIFGRSTSIAKLKAQSGHSKKEWWDACWPVHQKFLSVVRPKVIVTLGNGATSSAFGLLHARAGHPPWRPFGDEGPRGGWIFEASLPLGAHDLLDTKIVGVPHPSYFAPGPILAEMLSELADGYLTA